jgi:hypothetical protein
VVLGPRDFPVDETSAGSDTLVFAPRDGPSAQATTGRSFLPIGGTDRVLVAPMRKTVRGEYLVHTFAPGIQNVEVDHCGPDDDGSRKEEVELAGDSLAEETNSDPEDDGCRSP